MCGIFFSVNIDAPKEAIDIVSHRGPDAREWRKYDIHNCKICMGHARLKIIDLSTLANQPFESMDGDWVLLFNGAIYNYIELRAELEELGCRFATDSDTEVLLQAWIAWDVDALTRLNGMFAFLIFQRSTGRVFAARDRFGIKPLYFYKTKQGFAFASEIKQILCLPEVPRHLNMEAAFDFLEGGLTDHLPETWFQGVHQLEAGTYVDMNFMQMKKGISPKIWWHPATSKVKLSLTEAAKQFSDLFSQAIEQHTRADVKIGACLSGGLDSSSIVGTMQSINAARLDAFTAGFEGQDIDETYYAKAVAQQHATIVHHIVRPDVHGLMKALEKIIWHQDEPFGSSSIFAQWCVFEEASLNGIKVMMDGQGADELLGGYHTGFVYHLMWLLRTGRFFKAWKTISARKTHHGSNVKVEFREAVIKLLQRSRLKILLKVWRTLRGGRNKNRQHWLKGEAYDRFFETGRSDILGSVARRHNLDKPASLAELCVLMVTAISLPSLLRFEDRNSMAHSIESRVPFLDPSVAELCLNLGNAHKIDEEWTKVVLRSAMHGRIPEDVRTRMDKIGFATPEANWISTDLKKIFENSIMQTLDQFPTLFNLPESDKWLHPFLKGDAPYDSRIWRVFILGEWARAFDVTITEDKYQPACFAE